MRRSGILITLFAVACGSSTPPAPSPGPGTGSESISGRERIGWSQQAGDPTQLSTFRYAIYVDGARSEIAESSCAGTADSTGYPCSGRLPSMSNGTHTLELATFVISDGTTIESARSSSLRVTVTASTAPATTQWTGGEIETTRDGLTLRADKLAEGLDSPADAAFTPDGRLFIAERAGRIRVVADEQLQSSDALAPPGRGDGDTTRMLSIAVDPDFSRTRFVFVVHTAATADGPVFRLSRYRELRGTFGERAVLFESPLTSVTQASAVARFGSDGKVYLALGGDGSNGRLVRLNADGTMPHDQAGTTPAIASGVRGARGLAWDPRSGILWIADDEGDAGYLSGLSMSGPPVRAIVRGRRAIRAGIGSLAFYQSDALPEMRHDALIASAEGYLLRLRFGDDDPTRIARSERLLEQRVGPLRVVTVGPDGAIYFCTDTALGRLAKR